MSIDGARPPLPCEGSKGPCTVYEYLAIGALSALFFDSATTQARDSRDACCEPRAVPAIAGSKNASD